MRIISEDIDKAESAVIIDGRLFYDIDMLIATYRPGIEARAHAASVLQDEDSLSYSAGECAILDSIILSRDEMMGEHVSG